MMKVTGLIFTVFGMAFAGLPDLGEGPQGVTMKRMFFLAAGKIDGYSYIFRNGLVLLQGYHMEFGKDGVKTIISGFFTNENGHQVSLDGGVLYGHDLHPSDTEAIRSALSRTDITQEHFILQAGASSPKAVVEVTAGVISINGTYRNINAGVLFILMLDEAEPSTEGQGPVSSLTTGYQATGLIRVFTLAAAKLDGYAYIFQNGELIVQGPPLEIGDSGVFHVVSGFLTTETGHHVSVDGGLLYAHTLHPRNTEAIRSALSRADITLEHFSQQTGTASSPKVYEVTAGVVSIGGTYRNINAAVLFILNLEMLVPGTEGQTLFVTETAVPETLTISQPVTLTKTSTHDVYVTITSPVYNSAVATYTNHLKQTVTISEEQVIRSPEVGSIVVNTVPVSKLLVLTVTDTATSYFVSTALETVTSTIQHFSPNFSFNTITVNNIITSTVVHKITRTSITTAYITNTVGSTVYSTTAITVTISHSPATETFPVYY